MQQTAQQGAPSVKPCQAEARQQGSTAGAHSRARSHVWCVLGACWGMAAGGGRSPVVCTTPLGLPVLPLVYRKKRVSSLSIHSTSAGAEGREGSSGKGGAVGRTGQQGRVAAVHGAGGGKSGRPGLSARPEHGRTASCDALCVRRRRRGSARAVLTGLVWLLGDGVLPEGVAPCHHVGGLPGGGVLVDIHQAVLHLRPGRGQASRGDGRVGAGAEGAGWADQCRHVLKRAAQTRRPAAWRGGLGAAEPLAVLLARRLTSKPCCLAISQPWSAIFFRSMLLAPRLTPARGKRRGQAPGCGRLFASRGEKVQRGGCRVLRRK